VIGFATYGDFRAWPGYAQTVEHSLYVAPEHQRQGTGGLLLEALVARARADRLHVMVAGIAADNAASIALHAMLGFAEVGRMPEIGRKFDRWLDLVLMQLILDERRG
jgi:L-amino acid N-acyltransferase YncA